MVGQMVLRTSETSPFGRKVRIALLRLNLMDQVDIVAASPVDESDRLRIDNPLGKMPCLVLADGRGLFDSAVILEYLDQQHPGSLFPADPDARIGVLREQALADGTADAAVLMGSERLFHPADHVSERWIGHQRGKVLRGLAAFERALPDLARTTAGSISLACMLGYLDWRKPVDWRAEFPALVEWLDRFCTAVPEFERTRAA